MPKFYVMQQLPLGISAAAQPSFDNFVAGRNAEALAHVRDLAEGTLTERIVYVWGDGRRLARMRRWSSSTTCTSWIRRPSTRSSSRSTRRAMEDRQYSRPRIARP